MKKTLSLILALLMSLSCASAIFADDTAIADEAEAEVTAAIEEEAAVDEAEEEATPYDRAIRFLNTYGIMKGMEDGLLHAEKAVERYQMALFTGRIATGWVNDDTWEDFDANDSGFADLKGTAAENVYGAMSYVSQKGIIEGYPDGTFKPEKVVTYREALTMAVRTLGYQGLEYPWGYIEKAVALGLTDGITEVAYTDVINRGVAAQIIYNAMFADNSKLALKNFNIAFGWADAIITSTVVYDSEKTYYADKDYVTPTGYVAFQLIEKDGTLGTDVYYATADALGLGEGHADELALGAPYSILFAKDGDDNLVDIVDYEAYAAEVVKNEGRTDNEGVAYETVDKIGAYLADYTLVDKYSSKVLTNSGKLANEIIVKAAGKLTKTVINYGKTPFAFDWTTGDILEATKDSGGNYIYQKDEKGNVVKDANGNPVYAEYTIKYHYDKEFDRYFEIKTKADVNGTEKVIGISILDENDVADLKKAIDKACEETVTVGQRYVAASIGGIYAALNSYKTAEGSYATYEAYGYALLSHKADGYYCAKCDKKYDAFTINGAAVAPVVDCGSGDKHCDAAWWQDEYAPVLDEDGKIVEAYVIYGYNTVTKELKVIKTIEAYSKDLTDADTYYATGVLRGYSISKGYVVIGETKYYFNEDFGTFDLDQGGDNYKDGAYKAYLSDKFDGLFNQFVKYYLLDGKVVEIETVGATTENYLVVESYAGISSDGYIVVNGYSTDDLKLSRFRIASYNGWDEGDFFWYGKQITSEFVKGNVYQITSYDEDNDLYYVSVLGKVVEKGEDRNDKIIYHLAIDTDAKTATLTITGGYREYSDSEGNTSTKKLSSSDKYIIIGESKATAFNYMPIAVFEGKAQEGWTVTGQLLVGGKDSKTFIIVNATNVLGFNWDSWNNAGLVMVLDYKVLEKFYDGANANEGEWYLNGATEYGEVLAYNFYTGKFEDVTASTNLKPKKGNIYQTINGVLTQAYDEATFMQIFVAMGTTYMDWTIVNGQPMATATSDYVFETYVPVVADYFGDNAKKAFSKAEVSYVLGVNKNANDLVNSLKFVKIVTDEDGLVTGIESYGKDEYKADAKKYEGFAIKGHAVYAIREDGTVDVVVYIDPTTMTGTETVKEDVEVTTTNAIQIYEDAGIKATVVADKKTVIEDGKETTEYTVKSLGLTFFGSQPDKENHAAVYNHDLYFDYLGRCDVNDWHFTVAGEKVYGQDITPATYAYEKCDHETYGDEYKCALIKAIEAKLSGITVTEEATKDKVKWIIVDFEDSWGNKWNFDIALNIEGGKLVAKFGTNPDDHYVQDNNGYPVVAIENIK